MNKKEKHILNIKFMYEYYEDDITERYMGNLSTNVILDNDCFDIEPLEKIYVTPFKKYHQLEKENKELKEELKKASSNYTKYIQERDLKINKAIEFIETEHNTYPSAKEWRKALLDILRGEEND